MVSTWVVSTVAVSLLVMVASNPCVSPGEFLSGPKGFFSSPNFPSNFPTNSNCTWNITVPAGRIIKVTFLSFALHPNHNTNCDGTSGGPRVFITNVASDDGDPEFKICGAKLPDPVYSVGNFIQVTLRSDATGYKGFLATYKTMEGSELCPRGVTLTKTSGDITSPFYPRKYPDNQTCAWTITAPPGNYVKLDIDGRLNIQRCGGAACTCDYLQIQNGFSDDLNENERLCSAPGSKTFYSFQRSLKVLFVSDDERSKKYDGFKATYTQLDYTPPICPTEAIPLTGSGKLSSPNYPMSNYPADTNCSWIITAEPSDKLVKLVFTEFALGSCEFNCSSDNCTYVELYDGSSADSSSLGRFCNGSVLREVFSSGNQMFVKFRSGYPLGRGFEAQYTVLSGKTTTTTTTTTTTAPFTETTPPGEPTTGDPYGIAFDVKSDEAELRLANKEFLSNGNRTSYIQIIVIQLKVKDQDLGASTDKTYAKGKIDKDYEHREEGKPYITAEFDYGKRETFAIGDEKEYSRAGGSREYYNGKLESYTYYAAFQRSFDDHGSAYDSEKFVYFKTERSSLLSTVIALAVVLSFLVIILVLIIICLLVKRNGYRKTEQLNSNNDDRHNKKVGYEMEVAH